MGLFKEYFGNLFQSTCSMEIDLEVAMKHIETQLSKKDLVIIQRPFDG